MQKPYPTRILLTMAVMAFSFFSCSDDDDVDPLVIPSEYDGASFTTNAAAEIAVGQQLAALTAEAKKGRTNGTTVQLTTLNSLFTAGSPSLKSLATTYYAGKLEGSSGFFAQLSNASGGTYTPGTPEGEGGTYGVSPSIYLFDENGLEMEQLIEKGQFGAVMYNHAVSLMNGTLTTETTDKVLAIFGANPTFPSSNDANKHESPDKYLAVYAARRDKNDGNGFYSQIKNNLIKLQAAIAAGDDYQDDQQDAISSIKENWEKVNASTVINYLYAVISTLSATEQTDAQKASALHSYSETVGFMHGWRSIDEDDKIITDAQIDEILTLLNAPANGTATSYTFVTDAGNELSQLQEVITKLKSIYGFTDQEMEDFKQNWVSVQKR